MVPSPPKITMASASLEEAGSPSVHAVVDPAWNGCRSACDVPNPRMAAARMRGALEHIRQEMDAHVQLQGLRTRRAKSLLQTLLHKLHQVLLHLVVFGAVDIHHVP